MGRSWENEAAGRLQRLRNGPERRNELGQSTPGLLKEV